MSSKGNPLFFKRTTHLHTWKVLAQDIMGLSFENLMIALYLGIKFSMNLVSMGIPQYC
jgi:hypothetical protein